MSFKNDTSRFCNNFSIIPSHSSKLSWDWIGVSRSEREEKIENKNVPPHEQNGKTGHFTSWKEWEQQGNESIWKLHVQSVQD